MNLSAEGQGDYFLEVQGTSPGADDRPFVISSHPADGAAFAIVMAVTNPAADNRYARASQIIVPTDTPGYELVRNLPVMGDVGEGYMSHAELRFNGKSVQLPMLKSRSATSISKPRCV